MREALANLKRDFPGYDGRDYELAGFVWYHGWNDGVDPKNAVPEYEQNLVNLIQDVRKEFKSPGLPVVVGERLGPIRLAGRPVVPMLPWCRAHPASANHGETSADARRNLVSR